MLLLIDNYDSFTYNIAHYLGELGVAAQVCRNDALTLDDIRKHRPEQIVISPGPCTPDKAGISVDLIRNFAGDIPIMGICLGHQAIGRAFGGTVVRARRVMHGKTSMIHHSGEDVFAGLPSPFEATRYHSLVVAAGSLPDCLRIIAWTQDDQGCMEEIMGLRHVRYGVTGVQFHPESILTKVGHRILANFLCLAKGSSAVALRKGHHR